MDSSNLNAFVTDRYVRSSWIAFFTLWVLWGLSKFIRHATGREVNRATPAAHAEDTEAAASGKRAKRWGEHDTITDRLARAHKTLFENTLLLLSVLVLNTFGSASTRAVMILSWIFVALTIIHALTEAGYNHHFIRFGFNLLFFAITLAIGGLAFAYGWY